MDGKDLRIFETVARLGGMNRAAAELHTVQSNVTVRIRALEQEIGVALFERRSRGVALTRAGERLLPYATKIASLLADAKRAARDDETPKGVLTIGSLETTAAQRLPPIVTSFGRACPEVALVLKTGTNAMLIEQVLNHQLDGAFVCGPVRHPELMTQTAFREELVIAAARSVKSLVVALASPDLKILIKGPGCAYRARLEDFLTSRGIRPPSRMEFGTIEAIISCVESGLGISLLPRGLLAEAERKRRLSLHAVPRGQARVDILFIRRHDRLLFRALAAFIEHTVNGKVSLEAAE